MIVMTLLARIRLVIVAVMLLAVARAGPATRQKLGPDGAPNPTASVVERADAAASRFRASKGASTFPTRKRAC